MENIKKLAAIRDLMSQNNIDAYIIPSSDPHISEYLPDRFKAIAWTSGFTGSAGTLVITQDFAGLWTDSRYFVQAEEQLKGTGFELVKLKNQGVAEYADWLADKLKENQKVAFDGNLASVLLSQTFEEQLSPKGILIDGTSDLLDPLWTDRPNLPTGSAYLIGEELTGQSISNKLSTIREKIKKSHAQAHLISSLDDLAWTLNIRGNDVPCNPVVLGFLFITEDSATLYIDINKLSGEDKSVLNAAGVEIKAYDDVSADLSMLDARSILIDPKRTCYQIFSSINDKVNIIEDTNPSTFLKSVKNNTELANTRETMLKDGVALTKFFKWIEENMTNGELTEISIAEKLQNFRAEQEGFVDISFDTIAGYKEHGALPHYKATEKSNATLKSDGLLLVDSGGQYRTGTTDITRVISLGNITDQERQDYTTVLAGMIEGSMAIYPVGSKGYQIDTITRKPIWETLRNYGHGTGHGVGYFLNVHEGPQVFNPSNINITIEEGMITSIEPGLYRVGRYGIRIENLVLSSKFSENEFGEFMNFETLTVCYIDTDLVDKSLLEPKHAIWLNKYNAWVFEKLSPRLNPEEKDWLAKKTQGI